MQEKDETMIVWEMLKSAGGNWERSTETPAVLLPHPSSFTAFAALMSESAGYVVVEATELAGQVINQGSGRPFKMFARSEMSIIGAGVQLVYGLIWVDPVGLNLSMDVSLMSPSQGFPIEFPQPQMKGILYDWDRPGELFCTHYPTGDSGFHGAPGRAGLRRTQARRRTPWR